MNMCMSMCHYCLAYKDVMCIVVDAIVTVHLDQYYQCSEHLAWPCNIANMLLATVRPMYLLTLDMQLISLLYYADFLLIITHIFCLETINCSNCLHRFTFMMKILTIILHFYLVF